MGNIYLWQKHQQLQEVKRNLNFPHELKIDVFVVGGGMLSCEILAFVVFVSEN